METGLFILARRVLLKSGLSELPISVLHCLQFQVSASPHQYLFELKALLLAKQMLYHVSQNPDHLASVFIFQIRFHALASDHNPPISTFQAAGITVVHHHTRLGFGFIIQDHVLHQDQERHSNN